GADRRVPDFHRRQVHGVVSAPFAGPAVGADERSTRAQDHRNARGGQ
nr:hypothetical protein [Tanacetum cinerariifolium]